MYGVCSKQSEMQDHILVLVFASVAVAVALLPGGVVNIFFSSYYVLSKTAA